MKQSGTSAEPRHLFTDQERDAETALDYFGARFYEPWVGRFLEQDPELIGPVRGHQLRRHRERLRESESYAYALNRPTLLTDPTGAFADIGVVASNPLTNRQPGSWQPGVLGAMRTPEPIEQGGSGQNRDAALGAIGIIALRIGTIDPEPITRAIFITAGIGLTLYTAVQVQPIVSSAIGAVLQENGEDNNGENDAEKPQEERTLEEILKGKKASIQQAPLPPGSPSFNDPNFRKTKFKEIIEKAAKRVPGYKEIKKLLTVRGSTNEQIQVRIRHSLVLGASPEGEDSLSAKSIPRRRPSDRGGRSRRTLGDRVLERRLGRGRVISRRWKHL